MRQHTKVYNVYSFDELNTDAQSEAINGAINFFIECGYESLSEQMQKAVDKADKMRTPWFVGEYIYDYAKEEVLDFCKEYEYLEDGSFFNEYF